MYASSYDIFYLSNLIVNNCQLLGFVCKAIYIEKELSNKFNSLEVYGVHTFN